MRAITGILYRQIVKRILFLFSADSVHEFFLKTGRLMGRFGFAQKFVRLMWRYDDPILEQSILGLKFKNPIGLSAGFDYDGDLVNIMPAVGFGFNSVGTLTHEAYEGNPLPRLGRLPKSCALLVNKGFKNEGVAKVLSSMGDTTGESVRGVSIGSTNKVYQSFDDMVDDIVAGFHDAENFDNFDYYELNISCPNLTNLANIKEKLASPAGLTRVLERLLLFKLKRPVFIKMPVENTLEELGAIAEAAKEYDFVKGLIFSNCVKDRTNPVFDKDEIAKAGKGAFSGKPVEAGSNAALRHIYAKFGNRFVLIGVGGVFDAEDAYKKIRYGASLVQLITGMVYMGPQQIGVINIGLAKLLRRDGYRSIGEAVGTLTGGGD